MNRNLYCHVYQIIKRFKTFLNISLPNRLDSSTYCTFIFLTNRSFLSWLTKKQWIQSGRVEKMYMKKCVRSVKHRQYGSQIENENVLKLQLEKKLYEILRLRDIIDNSRLSKESFENEFQVIRDQLRESENERTSLLRLVDLSNNLIANYENLIRDYRTKLENSKNELEASRASNELLKKQSEEIKRSERRKQSEFDALKGKFNKESVEKGYLEQSVQKMVYLIEQYQEHIQVLENFMVDLVIENQKDDSGKFLLLKQQIKERTFNF